jgi:hypothetical protein
MVIFGSWFTGVAELTNRTLRPELSHAAREAEQSLIARGRVREQVSLSLHGPWTFLRHKRAYGG